MVGVLAGKLADVQRDAGVGGEGDEELLRQRGIEGAHHHRRHIGVPVQLAAPRDVHSRHDEGLVHGHGDVAEAADAALVAERLRERLPHDDARVLHRVMTVHLKVALAAHLQVEQAVAPERGEHVVEKPDARLHVRFARAVKADGQVDVGFLRGARDARNAFAHCCSPFSRRVRGDSGQITLRPQGVRPRCPGGRRSIPEAPGPYFGRISRRAARNSSFSWGRPAGNPAAWARG